MPYKHTQPEWSISRHKIWKDNNGNSLKKIRQRRGLSGPFKSALVRTEKEIQLRPAGKRSVAKTRHELISITDRIMSYLLKHLTRRIKNNVNKRFDASSIILKIEVVNVNRDLKQTTTATVFPLFKTWNGETLDYLSHKFIFRNATTSYRLRNSEMRLALPQPRTDYARKVYSYSSAALWNSLPTDI